MLDHDERDEQNGGRCEEAEDLGGRPAVAVPLDERVAEREEEADRGQEAREIDALLGGGVAGLADRANDRIDALSSDRAALWERVTAAPFLTLNEKREAVGYAPVEGGDKWG